MTDARIDRNSEDPRLKFPVPSWDGLAKEGYRVVLAETDWEEGEWACNRCGDIFHLYFNGGELDGHTCSCGRRWQQVPLRIDLIMREPVGEDTEEISREAAVKFLTEQLGEEWVGKSAEEIDALLRGTDWYKRRSGA